MTLGRLGWRWKALFGILKQKENLFLFYCNGTAVPGTVWVAMESPF
jgi:hypothetical protein